MRSTYIAMLTGSLFLQHQLTSAQKIPVNSHNTSATTRDNHHTYVVMASFFGVSFLLVCAYFFALNYTSCKSKCIDSEGPMPPWRGAANVRDGVAEVLENSTTIPAPSDDVSDSSPNPLSVVPL